jgi:hypothetical protein
MMRKRGAGDAETYAKPGGNTVHVSMLVLFSKQGPRSPGLRKGCGLVFELPELGPSGP